MELPNVYNTEFFLGFQQFQYALVDKRSFIKQAAGVHCREIFKCRKAKKKEREQRGKGTIGTYRQFGSVTTNVYESHNMHVTGRDTGNSEAGRHKSWPPVQQEPWMQKPVPTGQHP